MSTPSDNGRRAPPAFQQYAPDRLADRAFKTMAAVERGILHSMELEAWVNGTLPADTRELARVLGLEASEVEAGLTARVLRHFERRDVDGVEVFVCPELDAYRDRLLERHAKMSAGGKQSAARINSRRKDREASGEADSHPDSSPDSPLSRAELKGEERSSGSGSISEEHREWIDDYERAVVLEPAERVPERAPTTCVRCSGEGCRHCMPRRAGPAVEIEKI